MVGVILARLQVPPPSLGADGRGLVDLAPAGHGTGLTGIPLAHGDLTLRLLCTARYHGFVHVCPFTPWRAWWRVRTNRPHDSTCPHRSSPLHEHQHGRHDRPLRSPSTTSALRKTFWPRSTRPSKHFNDGDIVEGHIVKVDRDEVLLDIGYKTEGVIPSRELSIKHDVDPNEVVAVGDAVEALVLQKEDKDGRLILSKKRAQYERAWGTIEKIKEEDGVVTGTVIEVVKGGLILDIGLRGFLPASLVEMRRVRDLQPYVGKEIEAKIIELDKNRNNVVLSRRAWLEQTQSEVRTTFLKETRQGQVRPGVVSSIVNFGAFVDLGGVDGLVHVSELSWKHIDHPSGSSRSATRSPSRSWTSTWTASVSPCRSRRRRRTRGSTSLGPTRSVRSSRARSPSSSPSVPSCVSRTVSRSGPHLRAGRAPRGAAGAGRHRRVRHLRQGHRHRPRASPHQPQPQAGQ